MKVFTGRLFGDFHTNFLHSGIAHWALDKSGQFFNHRFIVATGGTSNTNAL